MRSTRPSWRSSPSSTSRAASSERRRAFRSTILTELCDPRDAHAPQISAAASGRVMVPKKTYGKTKSGRPITDEVVRELADKADAGYDVDKILRRRGGRPPMGTAAAPVE